MQLEPIKLSEQTTASKRVDESTEYGSGTNEQLSKKPTSSSLNQIYTG
jgi:hypothetical protein